MGTAIINYMVIFLMIGNSFVMPEDSFDNSPLRTQNINLQVKSFATGFEIPWGMAFLPDTSMLVTDLSGVLFRVYQNGKKDKIKGLPDVYYRGQGGLLDVEVHPDYFENNYIYISYSQPKGRTAFTAIARAQLIGNRLQDFNVIYSAKSKHFSKKSVHFGSRFAIWDDYLFFSIGD